MDFIEDDNSSDVLVRMMSTDGKTVTVVTAPETVFDGSNEPLITGFGDSIIVAINERKFRDDIREAVELNGDKYGHEAAMLPFSAMLKKVLIAVEQYFEAGNNDDL